ncbi:MAG: ABC transporter ATP-binding protein [Desulfopila sp.]
MALVGPNGSGKTTLAKHFNGIYANTPQSLQYMGTSLSSDVITKLRLATGVLFQDPDDHLFCNTLYEDVAFGPMNQGLPQDTVEQRVLDSLSAVGLEHLLYKPAHLLSYGQKKRAAFAAITAMQPEVLILDEPTGNLDPRQSEIFREILKAYTGTLIIIDHDLLFLYDLCDRAVVLSEGLIQHDYSFYELISRRESLKTYGLDFTFRFSCCSSNHIQSENVHHSHHHATHDHSTRTHLSAGEHHAFPLLELQHYSYRYPDGTPGIKDVNIVIRPGEKIALVGENGADKTTLASCLLGMNRGKGYFLFHNRVLRSADTNMLWRSIGMVFQNTADQLFCPSCAEEVAFGPRQLGVTGTELEERVHNALAMVHLQGFEEKVPLNMSGGQRKRLAIASVLSMQPDMIILDEPSAGLDPHGEELLLAILESLPATILLISHDLFFVQTLTSRTLVMHQGMIIRDYSTPEFLHDDHLQSINKLNYTYNNTVCERIQKMQAGTGSSPR